MEKSIKKLSLRNFEESPDPLGMLCASYAIIAVSCIFLMAFLFVAIVSKVLPEQELEPLRAIQADHYFCYLVPLAILPTYFVVYCNWLAMKFFEQN